jgi:dedicated sortase system histidine kinase
MSLRRQLLLVSLLVLVLPWAAYQYVQEMEQALRQAQRTGLLTTTRAIALLSSQYLRPYATSPRTLFAHRIDRPVIPDGYVSDWEQVAEWSQPVGFSGTRRDSGSTVTGAAPLRLVAGSRDDDLFLLLEAQDDSLRYFNPALSLPNGDRVLLRLLRDGEWRDYMFLTSAPGSVVARALDGRKLGAREPALQAGWQPFSEGFRVEIRIPALATVEQLAIFWVDSDADSPPRWWGTAENFATQTGMAVRAPEQELSNRLRDFIATGTHVRIIDAQGWVIADVERSAPTPSADMTVRSVTGAIAQRLVRAVLESEEVRAAPFSFARGQVEAGGLVDTALAEQGVVTAWYKPRRFADSAVAAAMPLTRDGDAAGVLLVEQRSDLVAAVTGLAMTRLVLLTFFAAIVVAGGLLVYASFLSWRIRRLRNSVESAIGEDGTITERFPESSAADEIGELSRGYGRLLRQVREYTAYLRKLASNLSHELRTPLAVVSSSLENLQSESLEGRSAVYAERAQQGAARLRAILGAMSEASRVEQALQGGDRQSFDLHALLRDVVPAYRDVYPKCRIELVCTHPERSYTAVGVPELIVQMLDKLIDNAADFTPAAGLVQVQLARHKASLVLSVKNEGPLLPEAMQSRLFDPMVTLREGKGNGPHLGFGLHIVRIIVQLHDGTVSARSAGDGSGVEIVIELPAP